MSTYPALDEYFQKAAEDAAIQKAAEDAPKQKADAAAKLPNGYAGPIINQESPQMDLMSQLRMFQQYKGNQMGQNPQSGNPYQQMQDSRFQQALSQPQVKQPMQDQAKPYYSQQAGQQGQPTQGNLGGK